MRIGAIKNLENNSYSIAMVNRHWDPQTITLEIENIDGETSFRKYIYDPGDVPFNYFGDLQEFSKKLQLKDRHFSDTIPGYSLVVYTSNFDEVPPASVTGLTTSMEEVDQRDANVLRWEPNTEEDFCYYRVYRSIQEQVEIIPRNQIATTVSTEYVDKRIRNLPPFHYQIIAVDKSGNSSE
jgi:hypothetical protein